MVSIFKKTLLDRRDSNKGSSRTCCSTRGGYLPPMVLVVISFWQLFNRHVSGGSTKSIVGPSMIKIRTSKYIFECLTCNITIHLRLSGHICAENLAFHLCNFSSLEYCVSCLCSIGDLERVKNGWEYSVTFKPVDKDGRSQISRCSQ